MRLAIGNRLSRNFIPRTDAPLHCFEDVHCVKSVIADLVLFKYIANPVLAVSRLKRVNNALVQRLQFARSIWR